MRRKATATCVFLSMVFAAGPVLAGLDVPFAFETRKTGLDTNAGGFAIGAYIAAPSAPSVSNITTGGSVAANTYYGVITYTDAAGETVISGQTSTTTTGTTSTITVTSPSAATGAKTWSAYFGTTSGGPYFPQGAGLPIGSNRSVTTTPPTTGTQPRGVDYSVQDSPQINVADGVANGTTTFTSATAGFTGAHVGNLIRVGSATWRHIVGVTNATTIVLDATVSTATSLPVVVGGALLTPGMAGGINLQTNNSIIFIKYNATAYTFSASTNVSGGGINISTPIAVVGYDTTRTVFNSDANRPTIQPSANSAVFFVFTGSGVHLSNCIFANPGAFTSCDISNNNQGTSVFHNLRVSGFRNLCGSGAAQTIVRFCDLSLSGAANFGSASRVIGTDWHDGESLSIGVGSTIVHSNFYNISTASSNVIQCNGDCCTIANVSIYHAFASSSSGTKSAVQLNSNCTVVNLVVEDLNPTSTGTGYVFNATGTPIYGVAASNVFYFNVKTALAEPSTLTTAQVYQATLLTASPFTTPGSGNFAPNNVAGGGAVIRGASLPTTFPAGPTSNYLDAGAAQSQSTSGGGKKVGPGGGKVGMLDPRSLFPFPRSRPIITRKAG